MAAVSATLLYLIGREQRIIQDSFQEQRPLVLLAFVGGPSVFVIILDSSTLPCKVGICVSSVH